MHINIKKNLEEDIRKKIFEQLKTKLVIEDKCIELKWCESLLSMTTLSENYNVDNDTIFLNFGECKIFGSLKIKLSTVKLKRQGERLNEIGGALNTNEEAKDLHRKIEKVLGQADNYSETYNEVYTYWEDENTKIIIYPRHHMGGEWFEYRIKTKNCT